MQAHYAGAIALDQLKSEQDRITGQLERITSRLSASAEQFDQIETNLKLALDLANDCHRAYLAADAPTRRLLNQAFFTQLFLDEDGARATLAEPFRTLLGPEVMRAAGRQGDGYVEEDDKASEEASPPKMVEATDWSAAYIGRIRAQRSLPETRNNKPALQAHCREGLKDNTLVPQKI